MLVLLHELPLEILEHILSFLSAKDLICASQTCRIFQQLGNHPSLWRQLCLSTWNLEWDGKNSARTFRGDSKTEIDEEIDAVSLICDEMNKMETNEKNKNINPWKEYFSQKSVMSSAQALTWKQLDTQTMKGIIPTPRYSHAAVAYQDKIFYFGGQISQAIRYNDLFSYCPGTNSWEQHKVEGLPNISKHSCVQIKGKIFSFGGFDGIARRFELGALDIASMQWSWPATTGSVPSSKSNHAAVAIGNKMYIFGGLQSVNTNLVDSNELHVLNADTMHWETPQVFGEIPQPRCGHRMTVIDGKIYLFGGGQGDNWAKKFNDLYVLDPATYEWTRPKTTGEAADATTFVSLFSLGRFLFIFGGGKHSNRGQVSNHLYMLDTVSMHWSKLTIGGITPSERDDCTTCILGDSVYFLHGYNSGPIDEFWKIQMSEEVCAIAKVPKMDREDKTLGLDKLKRKLNELFRISKRRIICPTWISALEEKQ